MNSKITVCIGYVVKGEPLNLPDGEYNLVSVAAPLPQQAAGEPYAAAEFASWQPASLSYRAFCNGCPYCFWECNGMAKQPILNWGEAGFTGAKHEQ